MSKVTSLVGYTLFHKAVTFLAFSLSNVPLCPEPALNVPLAFRLVTSFQKGLVLFVEPLI